MADYTLAQLLHDKFTRGGLLTEAEQALLEAWYERQDVKEAAQLAVSSPASSNVKSLCTEVHAALKRLNEATQQIQAQSDKNEVLCQENLALSRQLVP